jgi:hypothetical protein
MKSPLAGFRLPSERRAGSADFVPKILDGTLAAHAAAVEHVLPLVRFFL